MKLTVFGPTGGTGIQLVELALAAGHDVVAVARDPDSVTQQSPNLRVVKGDVLDPASLAGTVDGADAVLSALGSHSGRKPTDVYSRGMDNIRAAMNDAGVRRVVAISAIPVSPPQEKSFVDRYIAHPILRLFFKGSYEDLARMEAALRRAHDVDWTVVRPPRLLDGPATGDYRLAIEEQIPGAKDITRADLATAMLNALANPSLINKVVVIAR